MNNEEHALLAAILNTAVDAIIVIDTRGTIASVNPATRKLFGYSADEVYGKNVKMLMPSPYQEEHDRYLRDYEETGRTKIIGIGREVIGKRKDDSTFPMHLAVSEVMLGVKKLYVGIVRDISDIKTVQQQLTQANERLEDRVAERTAELREAQADLVKAERLATLGRVSGGIAHEIRNPLNAVRTSAYFLLNAEEISPEKMSEHLGRIDRQVSLIDNVITALSDVARLPEPHISATDVPEMIRDVVSTVSIPGNIIIENQVSADLELAMIDANQISIVFRNLLRNARDAMADGGTIRLKSSQLDQEIVIEVIDTGVGIPQEDLRRIAEPLYSTKARGMGLGLAISTAIIGKNHGKIEVESEVGSGTIFSIYLPTEYRPAKPQADA